MFHKSERYDNAVSECNTLSLQPIGRLAGDYPEKFGVPRQPGLVDAARGVISFFDPYDDPLAFEGITAYSHLWLSFVFDCSPQQWRPRVRPPRLGGNKRVGVFATRSTHRPNRLGQSVVRLLDVATFSRPQLPPRAWGQIVNRRARTHLLIGGHDLVTTTPIVDIKPYLPWVDHCHDARSDMAPAWPRTLSVNWSPSARAFVAARADGDSLQNLIEQVVAQDPRPAYRQGDPSRTYGVALRDVNVRFRVDDSGASGMACIIAVAVAGTNAPPPATSC